MRARNDRVDHSILFGKRSNRGIPQCVIRIVSYLYEKRQMCVRWGGTYSTFSVLLIGFVKVAFCRLAFFNIYVDDPSVALNDCPVGCCVGNVIITHLMYANDLVILAPYMLSTSVSC